MATQLTPQQLTSNGITVTYTSCDATGNYFLNYSGTFELRFKNNGTTSVTVHIDAPRPCSQGFTHPVDITVPAGAEIVVGRLSPDRFNDTNNYVNITYSDATNLQVALIQY